MHFSHLLRQSMVACQRNGDRTGDEHAELGRGEGELTLGRPAEAHRHYEW